MVRVVGVKHHSRNPREDALSRCNHASWCSNSTGGSSIVEYDSSTGTVVCRLTRQIAHPLETFFFSWNFPSWFLKNGESVNSERCGYGMICLDDSLIQSRHFRGVHPLSHVPSKAGLGESRLFVSVLPKLLHIRVW